MNAAAKPEAIIHIEHNPQTGKIRPFELYFTTDRGGKQFCGSFATMQSVKAKAKKWLRPILSGMP